MSIVVTAASGHLGHLVVRALLDRGVAPDQVLATGRTTEKLADLADLGVRTARLDYDDPATARAAIGEGDVVLLISSDAVGQRQAQHGAVIDAAIEAGAAHLAYTSILGGGTTDLVLAPEHVATEELVQGSGLPWTLLRNGWYTENYGPQLQQAAATGEIISSTGGGRIASAARADFAAAAAAVLADVAAGAGDHAGRTYELSGDTAWTFDELAAAMAEVLGRDVTSRDLDPAAHQRALVEAGLDEGTAGFLVALDAGIRDGALAIQTGDLARLIGRPTTPLVEALRPLAP